MVRWHARVAGFAAEPMAVEIATTRIGENIAIDDPDGLVASALEATRHPVPERDVLARLAGRASARMLDLPGRQVIDALVSARLLICDSDEPPTAHERLLESLAPAGVTGRSAARRMEAATVVVLGTGGIGSWVVDGLVRAGVGTLVIIDPDRVERSNLQRGCFVAADVGRSKVEVVADRARSISASVRVVSIDVRVDRPEDLAELARGADFVVASADEPSPQFVTRLVAEALVPERVPHVFAGYLGAAVRVGLLWVPSVRGLACVECARRSAVPERPLRTVTAFGLPQAQLTASLAVQATIPELVGGSSPLRGRVFVLDPVTGETWRAKVRRDPDCEVCGQVAAQPLRMAKGGDRNR